MELSELTNKELKNILRQNNVKNYSKLNKKELVKKVNQLIKAQNGGKGEKIKNGKKKYKLKELIGGVGNGTPTKVEDVKFENLREQQQQLQKVNTQGQQTASTSNISAQNPQGQQTASTSNISAQNLQGQQIAPPPYPPPSFQTASAPNFNNSQQNALIKQEENRQLNEATRRSLENQGGVINPAGVNNQEKCKACTIL